MPGQIPHEFAITDCPALCPIGNRVKQATMRGYHGHPCQGQAGITSTYLPIGIKAHSLDKLP